MIGIFILLMCAIFVIKTWSDYQAHLNEDHVQALNEKNQQLEAEMTESWQTIQPSDSESPDDFMNRLLQHLNETAEKYNDKDLVQENLRQRGYRTRAITSTILFTGFAAVLGLGMLGWSSNALLMIVIIVTALSFYGFVRARKSFQMSEAIK